MARYNLGDVKPHVEKAAYEIGPKFGITTIYGWAQGQYDHPKGLALDFMCERAAGDAITAYARANAKRLGITYIIWWHKYYGRENDFKPTAYTGTSNPHTDHVHISFSSNGASDGPIVDTPPGRNPVTDALGLPDMSWITDSQNWARLGYGLLGALLMTVAVLNIPAVQSVVSKGGKIAKAVVTKGRL